MYCEKTSTASVGNSRRSSIAARSPSSVWVGGMRTSTTHTSGGSARTDDRNAEASGTAATIENPRSVSSWTSPSRSTAASSAIVTRTGDAGDEVLIVPSPPAARR
jgi:hypothetical protein